MRFRINSPEVVSESFGGEVVAIHFGSGNYYSLTGTAAEILALLDAGLTSGEVSHQLTLQYNGNASDIEREVDSFLVALLQEGLVVAREPDDAVGLSRSNQQVTSVKSAIFEPPSLEKYGDMQDLLLLDPIHDVDEVGWPRALPDTPSAG